MEVIYPVQCDPLSQSKLYMPSFILRVADDEPASETEISQLQQLLTAMHMNKFRRTLASA